MNDKKIDLLYQETKDKKNYGSIYQRYVKRVFDIIVCLILLGPLLIVAIPVSIGIVLEDKGPVFYSSKRLGINFKEFGMLKFRSMKVNAPDIRNEDGSTYNSSNDPRVTKVGRFIRETSIDELPQILNILKGDMSFIGPRPGDVESKDTYSNEEKDKLLIRPGLTGYTQAYYRNSLNVHDNRMTDAWYAHNVSFALDCKILVKTVSTVLKRDNVYRN